MPTTPNKAGSLPCGERDLLHSGLRRFPNKECGSVVPVLIFFLGLLTLLPPNASPQKVEIQMYLKTYLFFCSLNAPFLATYLKINSHVYTVWALSVIGVPLLLANTTHKKPALQKRSGFIEKS